MVRFEPGEVIAGRYELEGKLASGGMASVYVATMRLARGLSRKVALKRVHPHLSEDPAFISMFVDEARLASELQHPGVVTVLDALEVGGELLLVLELVPGWDLETVLRAAEGRGERVPHEMAVRVARMGLETLAYVHAAKDTKGRGLDIVHRDVSPSNILIGADSSVRLLDFGVAKAARRSTRTATRTLKGKLAYMSPEQARGEALDGRSDVYALGLTLFEMLIGRRVNNGDEAQALQFAKAPTLPEVPADVPPDIASVVQRLLDLDSSSRATAAEAAKLLSEIDISDGTDATAAFVEKIQGSAARATLETGARKRSVDAALAALLDDEDETPATQAATPKAVAQQTPVRSLLVREERPIAAPVRTATADTPRRRLPTAALLGIVAALVAVFVVGAVYLSGDGQGSTGEDNAPTLPSFVRITSEPAGATLTIDNVARGTTPTVVELTTVDRAQVTFELDDYESVDEPFELVHGETVDVHAELARVPGRLTVTSEPSGATVAIDGADVGQTPLLLEDLPRAPIRVRISRDGRRTETREVDLESVREVSLEVRLRSANALGTLWINANIPNARVEVDGVRVGSSVPWRGRVEAGVHRVRVVAPDGRNETRRVRVRPGAVAREGFFL